MNNHKRVIFHLDMDAFFTSVEQRDNPALQNMPVVVGAKPGQRGVVSAASYEARRFGIHSAMPISEAFRRCPQAAFLRPRMNVYAEVSERIMEILRQFTPVIEQISIDEAFIDMSGTDRLFGSAPDTAKGIKKVIKQQQQLTASVGIAPNKFLAKIASDMNKPDGITVTPFVKQEVARWLAPLPAGKLWGVGAKTQQILQSIGVFTVSDLQALSFEYLKGKFGKQGESLYHLSRGIDERPVETPESLKSISRECTFRADSSDREEWKKVLLTLSEDVTRRARRYGLKGSTVYLTYRLPDFSRHSKRMPLPCPCDVTRIIHEHALRLMSQLQITSLRLIGVGICDFSRDHQLDLFESQNDIDRLKSAEKAVDTLLEKFGSRSVSRGSEIDSREQ